MSRLISNFVAFQLGWFGCVLGAANGTPAIGPVIVLAAAGLHLRLAARPVREAALLLAAAAIGLVFDSALVRAGWLSYPNGILWAGTAPYWIIALWVAFATTLNVSLRWLRGRPWIAAAFGAVGGPLSYLAGARLGAVEILDQQAAVAALALGWAAITPLLVALARRLDGVADEPELVGQHA